MLPEFDMYGNLPEGIHHATAEEVLARFAAPSVRRRWLGKRLQEVLARAKATGKLRRFITLGQFHHGQTGAGRSRSFADHDGGFRLHSSS